MARFHGNIGFVRTVESAPGVRSEVVEEYGYYGDVLRNTRRFEKGEHLNDDVNINNLFSVVGDPFAYQNLQNMRYVTWMDSRWKITNVEIQRPRLILTIGGIYNGPAD
jgi:hypothetical protein